MTNPTDAALAQAFRELRAEGMYDPRDFFHAVEHRARELDAASPKVDSGEWVRVPREATEEMLSALLGPMPPFVRYWYENGAMHCEQESAVKARTRAVEAYAAMLSASPALPHSGVDDAMVERTAKAIFAGMHPLWDWNLCPESHNESRRIARAALLAAVGEGKK